MWAVRAGEPAGAEAVEGDQDLLGDGLDGHGVDVGIAVGLEDPLGVGAVGLVAGHVGPHLVRGEQDHLVAELLELPGPEVGRAAGLHDHGRRRHLGEEGQEQLPGQKVRLRDPPRLVGDCRIEDRLCDVDGDHGMLFHGLLPIPFQRRLWHKMPTESQGGVHSIIEPDEGRAGEEPRPSQLISVFGGPSGRVRP